MYASLSLATNNHNLTQIDYDVSWTQSLPEDLALKFQETSSLFRLKDKPLFS